MNLTFNPLTAPDAALIFKWLEQDFIKKFWDNSQAHRDDIINFTEGRQTPSNYFGGKYVYWLAKADNQPFAMFMTILETPQDNLGLEKFKYLSKTGTAYGIDYMIGNIDFFGKGYGTKTLSDFIDYFRENVDPRADTFLIDPDANNSKAQHVYLKAGFMHVCDFLMQEGCAGAGQLHRLLVKSF